MTRTKEEIFSEIYSYLNTLGDWFINKIPKQEYDEIERARAKNYNPKYSIEDFENSKKMSDKTRKAIAFFHQKYWCENNNEKQELNQIFADNEKNLMEKYQPFKGNDKKLEVRSSYETQGVSKAPAVVKNEKTLFQKIIEIFKNLMRK